jgi:small subunit ribosomal protein S6
LRRYETIFILRPELGEAQIGENIKRFEGIITAGGGEIIESDLWGSRELAYPIAHARRGIYVRLDYAANGAILNEIERNLKIADNVIRFLSVLVETETDVAKAREEIETNRRKQAEARAAAAQAREKAAAVPVEEIPDAPEGLAEPAPDGDESA